MSHHAKLFCLTLSVSAILLLVRKFSYWESKDLEVLTNDFCNFSNSVSIETAAEILHSPVLPLASLRNVNPSVSWGSWRPSDCEVTEKLAVIIPYRNRAENLTLLLRFLHPFLQRQKRRYRIYVVNQTGQETFNRGSLLNIGFKHAVEDFSASCLIFHDVDLLPENPNFPYRCYKQAKLLATLQDRYNFEVLYQGYFGGVTAVSRTLFEAANGYSNFYFGWGGEDDDFHSRVILSGGSIGPTFQHERFLAMQHGKDKGNEDSFVRFYNLAKTQETWTSEGLSSMKYLLLKKEDIGVATVLHVSLSQDEYFHKIHTDSLWKAFYLQL